MRVLRWAEAFSRGVAALLLCTVVAAPGIGSADDSIARARAFLESVQLPWGAFPGAHVVDTAEAIEALEPGAARTAAQFALGLAIPDNREAALARVAALSDAGIPPVFAAGLGEADGWGLPVRVPAQDPLVLAWALRAAARTGERAAAEDLLGTLAALQREDGGFGFADNDGDISLTAAVVWAATADTWGAAAEPIVTRGRAWLRAQRSAWTTLPDVDVALLALALPRSDDAVLLSAELVARQDSNGSFDGGDVRATALAIRALRAALPDLELRLPVPLPFEPSTGTLFAIDLDVSNQGAASSPQASIDVHVFDGSGAVVFAGTVTAPPVAAGARATVRADLGLQGSPGVRRATFVINPGQSFPEASVARNFLAHDYRVLAPPDLVLEPADISLAPNPPTTLQASDVTVRVRNQGEAVAQNVHVQLFQGDPSAGGVLVSETVLNAVAPGVPRLLRAPVVVRTLDPLTLFARVDPEGALLEASDGNNTAFITVNPVKPADMTVDLSADCTSNGLVVQQGNSFSLDYRVSGSVRRFGSAYRFPESWPFAGATAVLYKNTPAGLVEIARRYFPAYNIAWGGGSSPVTFSTAGWADGTYEYTVVANPDHQVPDVNAANDTKTIAVTVQTGNVAEFWLEDARVDPSSVAPGGQVTARARVWNTGKVGATNVPVRFTLPGLTVTQIVPDLPVGTSVDLAQPYTAGTTAGTFNYTVAVDPNQTIPESVRTNNTKQVTFTVLGYDLEAVAISAVPDPVPVNDTATVTVQVKNVGVRSASYVSAEVQFVPPSGTIQTLGSTMVTSYPAPGETMTLTVPINTRTLVGDPTLRVRLQPSGGFPTFPIHVQNPNFTVSTGALTFSPGAPFAGGTVTPTVVVGNTGTLTAATSVRFYRGYAESRDLASQGTVVVPAGGAATFTSPPFALPSAPPYVVTVVVDEENAYLEPDEGDNRAARNALENDREVVIAFDETHVPLLSVAGDGPYWGGGYPDWARDLVARGYTVRSINPGPEGFTAADLVGVDVVVNVLPTTLYTDEEIATYQRFIEAGGGVLFIGDWGSVTGPPDWQAPEEDFLQRTFGVGMSYFSAWGSVFPSFNAEPTQSDLVLLAHPTTVGISSVVGNLMGGFTRLPANAQRVMTHRSLPVDEAAAAALAIGRGRVFLLGDTQPFDSGACCHNNSCMVPHEWDGNERFGIQVIDWLVNGRAEDALPDLAFVPDAITVSSESPVSGTELVATVVIRNVGATPASAGALVRLFDGTPPTAPVIGEARVEDLAVDGEQTLEFRWDTTHAAGDHVLVAVVDPEEQVEELDEAHNTASRALIVRAAHDLRVDPHDVVPARDGSGKVAVTVHNVGHSPVPAGTRLLLVDRAGDRETPTSVGLGAVPARGATSVAVPWRGVDLEQAHVLTVAADADHVLVDPTPADNTAAVSLSPPALEIISPAAGKSWGGLKDVSWRGSSDEGPLTFDVAIGREGGPFTGHGSTSSSLLNVDTRNYVDGAYRARVTATDGVLRTTREVPFVIANGQAVRAFGAGAGTATATIPAAGGATSFALPVATRVTNATMTATPVPAKSVIQPANNATNLGVYQLGDKLWYLSEESNATNVLLLTRSSADGGATWSAPATIAALPLADVRPMVAQNRYGLHIVYSIVGSTAAPRYLRSADGVTWTPSIAVPSGALSATDEGLLLVSRLGQTTLSQGSPDGTSWTPARDIAGLINQSDTRAVAAAGSIHLVGWDGNGTRYLRAQLGADPSVPGSVSAPLPLLDVQPTAVTLHATGESLFLVYATNVIGVGSNVWLQRCPLAANCSRRDAWLPAPARIGTGPSAVAVGSIRPDVLGFLWSYGSGLQQANGLQAGTRFSPEFLSRFTLSGTPAFSFADGFLGAAAKDGTSVTRFERTPGLTPIDVVVDVAADGAPDLARAGMEPDAIEVTDFASAVNAYVASHGDGDDGLVDGLIQVPVTVASRGVGQMVLRNLEVRYLPLAQVAGLAEPPLFSPGGSPGVLDVTTLSVLSTGPLVVTTAPGAVVRTLTTAYASGRYAAAFDGRDDTGVRLPSGVYAFGAPALPAATVEIDDLAPTAILRAGVDGGYGGLVRIHGTATDDDFAGTPRNFARYVLEYSLDGATYLPIAVGTAPRDGVLGTWNTEGLAAGAATLRLTVHDRAGNTTTTTQAVSVSPGAPAAPVIDAPTVAGVPVDSTTPSITVAGSAERNTTVKVFVNGTLVGEAPSTGRWSLSGVSLPEGVSTITASAARAGQESPRAQEVQVARYALTLAVASPSSAAVGDVLTATVTATRTSVGAAPVGVRVRVTASDGSATSLVASPSQQVLALPARGSASFQVTIATTSASPGAYTLVTETVSGATVPASAAAPLQLGGVASVVATLAADRAVYDPLQIAVLTMGVENVGSVATEPLTATVTVTGPGGASIALDALALASIARGDAASRSVLYGASPLVPGTYLAQLELWDGTGNLVATAATDFAVQAGSTRGAVAGTLLVAPTQYSRGDVLTAQFTVTNIAGPSEVPVSVFVVEAGSHALVTRQDLTLTTAPATTADATVELPTTAASGGELLVLLTARGVGLDGRSIAGTADEEAPVIVIAGFVDGELRDASVTPVVTIVDASPFTSDVRLNGQPFTSGTEVQADGDYVVTAEATDSGGRSAAASRAFTIDTTPPVIAISGVTPGQITNASVLPVVEVTDLHPTEPEILLDGFPWNGLLVSAEGDHVLEVHAEDLAGNVEDATVAFTIDKQPPVIAVSGVSNGALYGASVQPVVTVTDDHPLVPPYTATLDGALWAGPPVSAEGDRSLTVNATDAAGNVAAPVTVAFAIDRTAPLITVSGVTDGLLTREVLSPTVTIVEPHPGTASVLLDGAPYVSGTPIAAEREHVLAVSATDGAGNAAAPVTIAFTRDATAPAVSITGVTEGARYHVDARPAYAAEDLHLATVHATLDGAAFQSGSVVSGGGWHTVEVAATDGAGNTTTRTVTFEVVPVQASVTATLDATARILAVVNCDGQPATCVPTQSQVLQAALSGAGLSYEIVGDANTFLQRIRENRHNVRILYRSSSSATNSYWELRELTFEGGGLVVVNDASPDSDPKLREPMGITTSGRINTVGAVSITGGDLGPNRTITVAGSGVSQTPQAATAKVVGTTSKGAVATTNRYGSGRAVTLTFNPELNNTADMRALLVDTVRFAAGGALVPGVPGAPQYVKLQSALATPAGPLDFRLDAWTATGLLPLSDAGAPMTPPRTWTFPLVAGTPAARTLGVSAGQPGTYAVLGELTLTTGQPPRLIASGTVDVTITGSIADLKASAIAATQAVPAGLNDTAKAAALSALQAVDPAPATRAACRASITKALEATDKLKTISGTQAMEARLKTDQLLRALQVLYPTLP